MAAWAWVTEPLLTQRCRGAHRCHMLSETRQGRPLTDNFEVHQQADQAATIRKEPTRE